MDLKIHSIETFGTVDGPGVRYVVFVSGCPLRCSYCHNPDTWYLKDKKTVNLDDLLEDIEKYSNFLSGGVTISGGEPLLYPREITQLFKKLKQLGIHTCIDTSGYIEINEQIVELLEYTDLILLDIKHMNDSAHKKLTGVSNKKTFEFASYLNSMNKPVWIRHVLVPTINDSSKDLLDLKMFIDTLSNVEKIELLPYHELGKFKWKELGLEYKLNHIKTPTNESIMNAKKILNIK